MGSAAALSAANGISLTKMVCGIWTLGKKKYVEFEAEITQVHAESLRKKVNVIDKDTEAFNLVSVGLDMLQGDRGRQSCPSGSDATSPQGSDQITYGMMEDIFGCPANNSKGRRQVQYQCCQRPGSRSSQS